MKCLVTGASGFIGSHLTEFLLRQGLAVYALDKKLGRFLTNLPGDFHFIACNIVDRDQVTEAVASIRPDYVFHLAAQSLPKVSWEDPETTFRINVFGTLYLLDAIRAAGIDPSIVIFCSSGEYAISKDGKPISEDFPLEPYNPYALSKITQDHLSFLYWKAHQMRIVRVRPFLLSDRVRQAMSAPILPEVLLLLSVVRQKNLELGTWISYAIFWMCRMLSERFIYLLTRVFLVRSTTFAGERDIESVKSLLSISC
jgi:nucleoside-diphosphate-sugar epimerase